MDTSWGILAPAPGPVPPPPERGRSSREMRSSRPMPPLPAALLAELERIVGPDHVLTGRDLTAGYAVDWTGRFKGCAAAVVRPARTDEVAAVVRACAGAQVPLVPQGGNTGLVGGSVPLHGEVVVSTRRM